MRLSAASLIADAWALFRRDRDLLIRLAGPFWFVPSFALALLVPPTPSRPVGANTMADPATIAWAEQCAQWIVAQGPWFIAAWAIGAWGAATAYCLYCDRDTGDLRDALRRGAALWPRLLLLNALVGMIAGAGLLLFYLPGIYLLGRLLPAAPALVAERPLGALAAIGRGMRLSRGAGLPLAAVTAATLGIGWLASQPVMMLDIWLRNRPGGENMVAIALCDAGAAAVSSGAALAAVLLAVVAYRRLASSGT